MITLEKKVTLRKKSGTYNNVRAREGGHDESAAFNLEDTEQKLRATGHNYWADAIKSIRDEDKEYVLTASLLTSHLGKRLPSVEVESLLAIIQGR